MATHVKHEGEIVCDDPAAAWHCWLCDTWTDPNMSTCGNPDCVGAWHCPLCDSWTDSSLSSCGNPECVGAWYYCWLCDTWTDENMSTTCGDPDCGHERCWECVIESVESDAKSVER